MNKRQSHTEIWLADKKQAKQNGQNRQNAAKKQVLFTND